MLHMKPNEIVPKAVYKKGHLITCMASVKMSNAKNNKYSSLLRRFDWQVKQPRNICVLVEVEGQHSLHRLHQCTLKLFYSKIVFQKIMHS